MPARDRSRNTAAAFFERFEEGQQKSSLKQTNMINRTKSTAIITRRAGWRNSENMVMYHAALLRFNSCRDTARRTMEKALCTIFPISRETRTAAETGREGRKLRISRASDASTIKRMTIFSSLIRVLI